MGIYGALSTAVTGLRAQAFSLENISGNIANSQTTGFKRIDTDFLDLIPDAPQKRQAAGSVLAHSRSTNNVQGDIKSNDEGPSRGLRWVYFRAPWGAQLEFVSYPDHWPPGMA